MIITTGTRLGPYEIVAPLGAGGMGEVYRARDTRLGREVAVKILPAAVSGDADRLRRFEQEARAAGQLNHPNILTIYDIGSHDGAPYIVSELLDGEELRAQLNGGALPVRRAIDYARQIACGLSAAHEKGITHRDLKPENLFITTDGRVKILDFGLAKLKPQPVYAGVDSEAPTALPAPTTDPGTVMGTVGYMSPEQVQGQEAAHRADIFALGVILYEMLSGRRAFEGASSAEVMSAILRDEPAELQEINEKIPPQLERVVRRCLEKRPGQRFQSTSDLAFALEALSTPSGSRLETNAALAAMTPSPGTSSMLRREQLAWIAAGIFLLALIAVLPVLTTHFREGPAEVHAVRSFILPPEKSSFNSRGGPVTVSPDGHRLAFVATTTEGRNLLWVRELDALTPRALVGTEDASHPFWSPDSRSLGFFAGGKLKRIDAAGGPVLSLSDAPSGRGGTWNRDGVIVFAPGLGPLHRVSASGGASEPVTKLDEERGELIHLWPYFLPDGRHFLYLSRRFLSGGDEKDAIYVAALDAKESRLLLHAYSNIAYAQGYLLFQRGRTLLAQPFDAGRLATAGDAFPVAEQIQSEPTTSRGAFAVSEQGVLAYQTGTAASDYRLTWFERGGTPQGVLGDPGNYYTPAISPDGKRVAVQLGEVSSGTDIWIYEVARGLRTRFTSDPAAERHPVWSPDGSRIVFASTRKGPADLYQKAASGTSEEQPLLESRFDKYPGNFSPDGQFLIYYEIDPQTAGDIWVLPLAGDRKPFPFSNTRFNETNGLFSPNGHWITYQSDESGQMEIYVAPFPGPGGKQRVSTSGGTSPKWRGDGKEIFYLAPSNKLMAAEVNGAGKTFEVGAVRALFEARQTGPGYVYDVAGDGQRFLVITAVEEKTSAPITLVLNWTAELKR